MGLTTVTLLLNATYEPLCVVSSRRAVVLILAAKAVAVHDTDQALHSATTVVAIPSVARLTRFVRVPYPAQVPLSRKGVFARDGGRCAYCGGSATSIDHVVPRSRGGPHTWDNVVAACRPCNVHKADRLLTETRLHLARHPSVPRRMSWVSVAVPHVPPQWRPWLPAVA